MSSFPLILISGCNGFVGFAVLTGFRVRAAVRRQDLIDHISRALSVQRYLCTGDLKFALVPNNTLPGAYNGAAKDCSYIIHVASPLATRPGDLVSQAIAGTEAILEAAQATLSVRRVVFTGSTSSVRPFERLLLTYPANQAIMSGKDEQVLALTAETRVPAQPPVPDDAPGFHRYINSKIAAINLVDEYVATQEFKTTHFSIINIMPGWILGPEELARNKQEAFNTILAWLFADLSLARFLGLPADEYPPVLSKTVHLDDIIEAHVNALNTDQVPGKYRSFLLCSDASTGPELMSAVDIVRRELPQEVSDGKIPFVGKLGTIKSKLDVTSTERHLLGHPLQPYEKQVKDTIKWFVHLSD